MTPKQKRFVDEYLIDLNATQAAIRAGYAESSASDIGRQLLRKTPVASEIALRQTQIETKAIVTREEVLRELRAIGMADIRKIYDADGNLKPIGDLDDETAAAIAGVETVTEVSGRGEDREVSIVRKVKRFDKNKALELLGRHLGLWEDKGSQLSVFNIQINL